MLRSCSNRGVTHTPSGCETLPQRVVLNAFCGRLAIDFWGEKTRSLLGWRFCKKSSRHLEICGPIEIMQKIEKKNMTLKIAKKWSKNDFKAKKKKIFLLEENFFADF